MATGSPRNETIVAKARYYFNGFQGFQHVYQSMLAAANHKVPGFNYNAKFPGSSQYIIDSYPMQPEPSARTASPSCRTPSCIPSRTTVAKNGCSVRLQVRPSTARH
jgi:hypothetical protein